jgi:hypothetical protein
MKIKVTASTGFVGSSRSRIIEEDDDWWNEMTLEEKDKYAAETVWELID